MSIQTNLTDITNKTWQVRAQIEQSDWHNHEKVCLMRIANAPSRSSKTMRWIARIWSLLIFLSVLIRIFTPDPNATEPVPLEDWFLLSLWGLAILGLLLAWRWELVGGILTIAVMFVRELAWVILKGGWLVNFLIIWLAVIPPAILFLGAWRLDKKMENAYPS